jgi:hypothetical protein
VFVLVIMGMFGRVPPDVCSSAQLDQMLYRLAQLDQMLCRLVQRLIAWFPAA